MTRRRSAIPGRRALLGIALLAGTACARHAPPQLIPERPGGSSQFTVTAYCKGKRTASGARPAAGIVAADPRLLPIGTLIGLTGLEDKYNGVYTVMDTGPRILGRQIDLYVANCSEAVRFGRRSAGVSVLRLGRDPRRKK